MEQKNKKKWESDVLREGGLCVDSEPGAGARVDLFSRGGGG